MIPAPPAVKNLKSLLLLPPLQAHRLSDGSSSPVMVAVVTKIMHVFADALPHVPEHRRLPVLSQLVNALGPDHFLWILLLLLLKLHATRSSGAGEKVRRGRRPSLP